MQISHRLAIRILERTLGVTHNRTKGRRQGRTAVTEAVINTGAEAANLQGVKGKDMGITPRVAARTRELLDLTQTLVEVRMGAVMRVGRAVADLEPVREEATRR